MARIVRCPSCGAAHRVITGQTQLNCDYCRTVVQAESVVSYEEWYSAAPVDPTHSRDVAEHELRRAGVHQFKVQVEAVQLHAVWQLVSSEGEEHQLAAVESGNPLLSQLAIPSVPFDLREQAAWEEALPTQTVQREQAESAALATFGGRDASVATTRLFWFRYHPLRIDTPAGELSGLHLPGGERVWLESLPPQARRLPANRQLLLRYSIYTLAAFSAALLIPGWLERAVALGVCCSAVSLLWRPWIARQGGAS